MGKIKRISFLRTPTIYPPGSNGINAPLFPPLGISIITSSLRNKGYFVDQDDLNIKVAYNNYMSKKKISINKINNFKGFIDCLNGKKNSCTNIINSILSLTNINNPDMILLSAPNSLFDQSSIRILFLISKFLKKQYNVPIVIGSESDHLPNACEYGLRQGLFDFMITGSGEESIIKLIETIENEEDLKKVPGLFFISNNKLLINQLNYPNLEIIPDFDGLPLDLYRWSKEGEKGMLIIPYRFTYGCPRNCAFCIESKDKKVGFLDYEVAVKNIQYLKDKYKSKYFLFLNNYINGSRIYAENFCNELINKNVGILWSDCGSERNLDYDLLVLMKKSGCIRLILGFETGSPRLLQLMNKKTSLDNLSKMLKFSNELGIWSGIEIIAGLPTENQEDIKQTIKFLKDNEEYIDEMYLNKFRAIVGTEIAKNPQNFSLKNFKFNFGNKFLSRKGYFDVSSATYDEEDGPNWNKKRQNIINSERLIKKSFPQKSFMLAQEQLNILFYLYSNYDSKAAIRTKYHKMMKNEYRKMLFNINSLVWQIKNLGSIRFVVNKISKVVIKDIPRGGNKGAFIPFDPGGYMVGVLKNEILLIFPISEKDFF